MRDDQKTYAENLEEASKHYTDAELKALRRRAPTSDDMFDKIVQNVMTMSAFLFAANPNVKELPPARELGYTFVFRYALAGYMVALRGSRTAARGTSSPKRFAMTLSTQPMPLMRHIFKVFCPMTRRPTIFTVTRSRS
jgi:hypothetical protein